VPHSLLLRARVADPVVELVSVRRTFDAGEVLRGVTFTLARGETLVVMGGSGSGKTVLLRLIAGLIRPDAGQIRVFGRSIEGLSEEELLPVRRRMGYVFQGAAASATRRSWSRTASSWPRRWRTGSPSSSTAGSPRSVR